MATAKFDVDIKVLYNDTVVVELDENATRAEIVEAAKAKYEAEGPAHTEYGEHVFDDDTWTINRQGAEGVEGYVGPIRSVEG